VRIVFAGTPDFSLPTLESLITEHCHSEAELVAVYTQPDRPAGRGRRLSTSPVKKRAVEAGLRIEQPATLRSADEQQALARIEPDLVVVVAYGLILPRTVLGIPRLGCINVHASLLPRWRGAAPIQRAILAGDQCTGISIMKMSEGLDEGPVYLRRELEISKDETGATLHERLAAMAATALMDALPGITNGQSMAEPQDETQVCYAGKISKTDAHLDFNLDATTLERMVRAFNAWPVAWCKWRNSPTDPENTLRIWRAKVAEQSTPGMMPGTVVCADKNGIRIATAAGDLLAGQLQLPGRKPLQAVDFCNACDLTGMRLY